MSKIEEAIKDGNQLIEEMKIDDTSLFTLNNELKRQSLLQTELLLLLRYAKIKLNDAETYEEKLTAQMIKKICAQAEAEGKPIASTSKDKLKKTELPLYKEYNEARRKTLEAEEETKYLESLQYICSKRADLLMAITNLDRNRVIQDAVLNSDIGMKSRVRLYERKLKEIIK